MDLATLRALINTDVVDNALGDITALEINTILQDMLSVALMPQRDIIIASVGGNIALTSLHGDVLIKLTTPAIANILLPSAALATRPILVKDLAGNSNSFNLTIVPNGTETIDGSNVNYVLATDFSWYRFVPLSDGSGWYTA